MKTQKNLIIAKLSLLSLILLPISQSYGMMPRLRLGLQESLKAAAAYRTTFSNALNPTFKKHASTISRGIVKTAAFGGIAVASVYKYPGGSPLSYPEDLTRKQFQLDFWPNDNNETFLDNIIMEQSPEAIFYTFLKHPKLFTKETFKKFLKHNSQVIEQYYYFMNQIPQEFKELLNPYVFEKGSRNIIVSFLLYDPYFFTKEQEQKIVALYADQIVKDICTFNIKILPDHLLTVLRPLIIEKGRINLIVNCLAEIPNFFTKEEQQQILARNDKTTLETFVYRKDLENISDEAKNTLRALIINQGSEWTLFNFLLLPGFFTPEEKKAIFKKIIFWIVNYAADSEDLNNLPQDLKDLLLQDILKGAYQNFAFKFLLNMPTLFNEEQQAGIIAKNSNAILKNIKPSIIKDLSPAAQTLLRPLIIKKGSPQLIIECLTTIRDFFSEQEQQKIIKLHFSTLLHSKNSFDYNDGLHESSKKLLKNKASENISTLSTLLLKAPTLFSEEEQTQLICLHRETIVTVLEGSDCDQSFYKKPEHFKALLGTLISEKGSPKLIKNALSKLPELFSEAQTKKLIDKLNTEYSNPLAEAEQNGPLFSNYLEKNKDNYLNLFSSRDDQPHFYNLLPFISEYAQKEYKQNRIILFHGQKSIWVLLEMIYNTLLNLKNNTQPSDSFRHLRFQEQSNISAFSVWRIRNYGTHYMAGVKNKDGDAILFTNLHPAANNEGSNSWYYAAKNHDLSEDEESFYLEIVERMFADLGMIEEYKILQQKSPGFFDLLYESFNTVVKTQGNHGNLAAISMPKDLAEKLIYSTHGNGSPMPLTVEKDGHTITTTSAVALFENYNSVPFHNAYALIFDNRIINKEAAQKSGVTIRYFNTFEDTEGYLKIVKMFKEELSTIKNHTT